MSSPRLTVLVADFDLLSGTGDHCAIYRELFQHVPEVHFTYLRDVEAETYDRPGNVSTISCFGVVPSIDLQTTDELLWAHACASAEVVAAAVGDQSFDVLEIPGHQVRFLMLSEALRRRGAKIGKVVAAFFEEHASSIQARWIDQRPTSRSAKNRVR